MTALLLQLPQTTGQYWDVCGCMAGCIDVCKIVRYPGMSSMDKQRGFGVIDISYDILVLE